MCWSAEVSLNTFIFSIFGTVFALANGTITVPEALFIVSFASMQLVEYFAWSNLKDTITASKFGLALILLQPLLSINAWYTGPYKAWVLAGYVVAVVLMLTTRTFQFSMHPAQNGHLSWDFLHGSAWFYTVWFALFFLGLYYAGALSFGSGALILLLSVASYLRDDTWGSMWCWFANGAAVYMIGQVFYKNLCR